MTEEDIKLRFITPALQKGWKGFISMEVSIADGKLQFVEYDYLTGLEVLIPIDKNPSRDELIRHYEIERGMTESED